MELLALGKLAGHKGNPEAGVRVPQEFDADDFVQLMAEYEFPGGRPRDGLAVQAGRGQGGAHAAGPLGRQTPRSAQ